MCDGSLILGGVVLFNVSQICFHPELDTLKMRMEPVCNEKQTYTYASCVFAVCPINIMQRHWQRPLTPALRGLIAMPYNSISHQREAPRHKSLILVNHPSDRHEHPRSQNLTPLAFFVSRRQPVIHHPYPLLRL